VRDRHPDLLGRPTRQRDDLGELFSRELGRYAAPLLVPENFQQHRLQFVVRDLRAAGRSHLVLRRGEPPSPAIDPLLVNPQRRSLGDARSPLSGPQDDLHSLSQSSLQLPRPCQVLESHSLPLIQDHSLGRSRHRQTLILPSSPSNSVKTSARVY
jgi:hypothetical protein